jgi:hypothetical protein
VLAVDKLENNPGALEVFGITELSEVPRIVRVVLTPAKALDPTLKLAGVDVYPRLIVARAEQVLNALAPIVVTLLGIVKAVNPVRPLKAESPIAVILVSVGLLIVTVVVVDKVLNILFGITQLVVVPWIVRVVLTPAKALDPTLKLAGVDVYPRLIVARAEQVLNALAPIIVTLLGIVIVVSEVHDSNALAPMLVTLFGIVTVVSLLHPLNVFALMLVTLLGIIMLVRPVQS